MTPTTTTISLADLDGMSFEEARAQPFEVRDRLLDDALRQGRKVLGPQLERHVGLFSDWVEEDLGRMLKLKAARMICSGFIPIDSAGNVPSTDAVAQFRLCFENMRRALEKMGSRMDRVTHMIVFLADMSRWADMNVVYREFFSAPAPTRASIGTAGLNRNYQIEVASAIAYKVLP